MSGRHWKSIRAVGNNRNSGEAAQVYLALSFLCGKLLRIYKGAKMRSAQAPFGAWAIMKKFIYVCNVLTLHVRLIAMFKVYSSNMNKL